MDYEEPWDTPTAPVDLLSFVDFVRNDLDGTTSALNTYAGELGTLPLSQWQDAVIYAHERLQWMDGELQRLGYRCTHTASVEVMLPYTGQEL